MRSGLRRQTMIEMSTQFWVVLSILLTFTQISTGSGLEQPSGDGAGWVDVHIAPVHGPDISDHNLSSYYVTSGDIRIQVKGDHSKRVILHCSVSTHSNLYDDKMEPDHLLSVLQIEWESLLQRCQQLSRDNEVLGGINEVMNSESQRNKREVKSSGRSTVKPGYLPDGNKLGNLLILNGTNWCGTGNKAKDYEDLGFYQGVDECCRSHDYCKHFIPNFTTKYRYSNSRPYTISFCECDYDFYMCLKASDDEKAMEVGDLFFHTIGVPCFNFEYGEYCKDETSFLFCNGGYDLGDTVTLNYVLSDIWKQDTMRTSLP